MTETRVKVVNCYAIAGALVWAFLIVWLIFTLLSHYSAADVRSVCVGHQGVQQVMDNTWTGGPDKATVVCRDGWVGDV